MFCRASYSKVGGLKTNTMTKKTRTVVIGFRDDRKYEDFQKYIKIERPTNRRKVLKLLEEGFTLKQIARLPNKEIEDLCVSDGLIVQARKMIWEKQK